MFGILKKTARTEVSDEEKFIVICYETPHHDDQMVD
jgi:hypothetical protein